MTPFMYQCYIYNVSDGSDKWLAVNKDTMRKANRAYEDLKKVLNQGYYISKPKLVNLRK